MKSEVHSRSSAGPQSHPPARQPRGEWLQRCLEPAARCSLCRHPGGSCGPRPSQTLPDPLTSKNIPEAAISCAHFLLGILVIICFDPFQGFFKFFTVFEANKESADSLTKLQAGGRQGQSLVEGGDSVGVLGGTCTYLGVLVPPHMPGLPQGLADSSVLTK